MNDSAVPAAAPASRKPVMYRNGSVYSAADPFATAMLVDGGTVAWVGSEQAAASIADSTMDVIDLKGSLVAPGFVDSHVHLTETGIALDGLQLAGVRSARELLDAVAASAASGAAGIVLGHGWDETLWSDPTLPSPEELDRAAGGRRVYLARVDSHSALVSPALAADAQLTGLNGHGAGAHVVRNAHTAARLSARRLTDSERRGYQRRALSEAAANGYVALAEMAAPHICADADLRLSASWNDDPSAATPQVLPYWGELAASAEHAQDILDRLGVRVLGLAGDLNIDGSIGSRTAALGADYDDAPGERGSLYLTVDEAAAHLAACSVLGIQAGFHVIGDAGLAAALDALDTAAADVGEQRIRAAGHRFEHVELADSNAVARLAKYSITVSAQPAFDAAWGGPGSLYEQRLGNRSRSMNPFASFYSVGVPVCFGSDSPVTPLRPWSSVRACLEHSSPDQRISARAAFIGHTRAGWRASRHSNPLMGQLVPGAPASFAVWEVEELMVQVADNRVQSWSTDPRARTPLLPALDTGNDPACLQTVRDGQELFASPALRS